MKYDFGNWSENYVAQYLETKGYKILDKNYRKPWGEIDVIAKKDGIIVFVEVKANKEEVTGFEPEKRVNSEKLRKINLAIQTYLAQKKYDSGQDIQIDVVSLTIDRGRGVVKIRHFKNVDM